MFENKLKVCLNYVLYPIWLIGWDGGFIVSGTKLNQSYLFGAQPTGGMWGSLVNLSTGSTTTHHLTYGGYYRLHHHIGSVSYDPISRDVLMDLHDDKTNQVSLAYGPLCSNRTQHPEIFLNSSMYTTIYEDNANCTKCKISCFAFYNSQIYFILIGDFVSSVDGNATKKVQVRMLYNCIECVKWYLKHQDSFNFTSFVSCSRLISEVYSEEINSDPSPDKPKILAANGMEIIKEGKKLAFFFQLLTEEKKQSNSKTILKMKLYHVTQDGEITLLYNEIVHGDIEDWDLRAIGSVDYKKGILCWTMINRLFCAEYEDKSLYDVTMLLYPAEGASSQVCLGSRLNLLGVVTGVAIVSVTPTSRTIAFGCFPQYPGLGGTGLIKTDMDWRHKEIVSVSRGFTRLQSGFLLQVDELSDDCKTEEKVRICKSMPDVQSLLNIRDLSELGINHDDLENDDVAVIHQHVSILFITSLLLFQNQIKQII